MSEQVFADGIGPIVVVGGTVRLDFITLVADEGEGGARAKPVVQHRLFMPIEAFKAAAHRLPRPPAQSPSSNTSKPGPSPPLRWHP